MLVEYQWNSMADMDDERIRVTIRGASTHDIRVLRRDRDHDTAEE